MCKYFWNLYVLIYYTGDDEKENDNDNEGPASETSSTEQMASTYNKMIKEYNKKSPSEKKMEFYLLSEKVGRRGYIDVCTQSKVEDKVAHIVERYPMFKEIHFVSSILKINQSYY